MPENQRSDAAAGQAQDSQFRVSAPQLNLPKGGGAIRGIGEKFGANPVTGTGSLSVPVYASPGRSGFGPQLSLSYDSGSGNGPFGFGWSLDLPTISRKTDKGLPQYADATESDTFILAGAEDLVPSLVRANGLWKRDTVSSRTVYGEKYEIHRYRPRVEGLFARIERWVNRSDAEDTFWRSITKDNITTWYGKTSESRVFNPADPSQVFSWLVCESCDDKGNVVLYQYKSDNSQGIDLTQVHERNRTDGSRSANRYIKCISYGNRTPYFPNLTAVAPIALPTDWCFQLVFDYGEHDLQAPVPRDLGQPWNSRLDSFSTYRPTFEVRTHRLCRRMLMFHHFETELDIGLDCLVRSTNLSHSSAPADPTRPFYSYLISVTQSGYVRDGFGGYLSNSLPPVEFEYTEPEIDERVRNVDPESLKNLPYGLGGSDYRWVDLNGEGLSGILTEQAGTLFYKPNLSPINQQTIGGVDVTLPQFGPLRPIALQPALSASGLGQDQLMDLSGDGQLDLVAFEGPVPGFFERTEDETWEPFTPFESLPLLDWKNPNLRFVDLTGDGLTDLIISEDDALWWHASLSEKGFGPAQRVVQAQNEEKGPHLVFADGTESVFLADLSGDGLADLVRVRLGEVSYWPNLGYGRFGSRVTMDGSPWLESQDLFDARRIRLVDIDGSGTSDIIYFASGETHVYFNQSGNAWGSKRALSRFPSVDSASSASALDLLGNGTACLVWSSGLPGNTSNPMRYIDLMGGQKPHLLVRVTNNLGAETIIQYAPSTKFYLADKLAGTPWLTRLPFPVHVVERVETYDYVSRNRFVTSYSYHHGHFDGVEREFRGFARVDQWDTQLLETLAISSAFPQATNENAVSHVPPAWTKTWFHTGAFIGDSISKQLEAEYYSEGGASDVTNGLTSAQLEAMLLDDTDIPTTVLLPDSSRAGYDLSGEETREACRALRGSILRQEIYAHDGTDKSGRPYSVTERNYTVEILQPQRPTRHGVFFVHPRETINFHYERKLFEVIGDTLVDPDAPPANAKNAADPRVTHTINLAMDPFGNVLQSVAIAYGRRYLDPSLTPENQSKQSTSLCTYTENTYTNLALTDDAYRTPLPSEVSTYQLINIKPDSALLRVTNLFRFDEMQAKVTAASDGAHDIPYENLNPTGLSAGQPYRRLFQRTRTVYRPDDMGKAAGDPMALLPLRTLEPLGLPGSNYRLAFTPGLISQVYQRRGTALLPIPANVLGSVAADGGGYVDLDSDGRFWVPSGRIFYRPVAATPLQEKSQARQHFFMPRRFEDPFGNATSVDYDEPHDILVVKTTDAVTNTATASNDYRVLAPSLLTDPNDNRTAVSFDVLGLVAGTAVMGKNTESLGDSFASFTADLTQTQIDNFYAANDPHTVAGTLLGTATTRIVYDVLRFFNTKQASPTDPTKWLPVFAATVARETHVSDLTAGQQSNRQITFSYSDGYGREIQKKVQAEPGAVADGGPVVNPRWVGSGWTIFNNKGKPVRQYEPFFSQLPKRGHQFEFGSQAGVSPILCYDPLERVVATIHPDHTYEKIAFDPWRQESWDVNDTVLRTDPRTDSDVGEFFQLLPNANYSPSWYTRRAGGALGPQEQDAATKAAAHANTPTISYLDTLGRTFLVVLDNAAAGKYATHSELDVEGNERAVTDALRRKVMVYEYNMVRDHIYQISMEAGEHWVLNDIAGKAIRTWDIRGHNLTIAYDVLRRPTSLFVLGTDAANSDPRTLGATVAYEQIDYGEGRPADKALNLRARVFQHRDAAGVVSNVGRNSATNQNEGFDFKGNLLSSSRQFVRDYGPLPNWSVAPPGELFTSSTRYDALNRPIALTTPDGSVTHPTYNEASLLETVSVNVGGARIATSYVANIDYNAKGQRILIEYGNNGTSTPYASTAYTYASDTFRLIRLKTTRRGVPVNQRVVQDLSYTYDPSGNVTHIQDNADIQNVVFFRNKRVEPSNDYVYDAIYRLIQASGREQLGLAGTVRLPPMPTSYNDALRTGLLSPGDGKAMGTYDEEYRYDAVGNFLKFIHRGSDPAHPGWTRSYTYKEVSLLEPPKNSNRLTSTALTGTQVLKENYAHDLHGNMTGMPQLQIMEWDFKDELHMTQRQAVSTSDADGKLHQGERTYYVYDAAGQRMRKTTQSAAGIKTKERFYVGAFELYREYNANGKVTLARESLHVMGDKKRVALVETKTVDASAPPTSLPSATTRYQFDNHLGTSCLELDETASVISYEEYYPYGSTSYQAGGSVAEVGLKRYRYTGLERDEETGLAYHSTRYYVTWLGRWSSPDVTGTADTVNLYQYVSGNPARLVDPQGTSGWDRFLGGLKAVGGAFETAAGVGLVGLGVATSEIGIGIPIAAAGVFVTAHGADTVVSGARTAWRGEAVDTFTSQGLQAAGMSRQGANLTDAGIGIVGSLGASAAARAPGAVAAVADAAPVVMRAVPGVVEAAPAVAGAAESAPTAVQGLVHLTTADSAAAIRAADTLGKGGTIYAGPASLANASAAGIVVRTGLLPSEATAAIALPAAASDAFRVPAVIGPITAWQRVAGTVYSAGAGSINLTTGAFTRVGPATNQIVVYGIDLTISTTLRSGPDIVNSLVGPSSSQVSSDLPGSSRSGLSAFAPPKTPAPSQAEITAQQCLVPGLR